MTGKTEALTMFCDSTLDCSRASPRATRPIRRCVTICCRTWRSLYGAPCRTGEGKRRCAPSLHAWRTTAARLTWSDRCAAPLGGALSDDWIEPRHGPDGHAELEERRVRLQDAVRRLPLSQRQAVTLALEGFSHAEIADALGITANSVGVRLNRAKAALKSVLGEDA